MSVNWNKPIFTSPPHPLDKTAGPNGEKKIGNKENQRSSSPLRGNSKNYSVTTNLPQHLKFTDSQARRALFSPLSNYGEGPNLETRPRSAPLRKLVGKNEFSGAQRSMLKGKSVQLDSKSDLSEGEPPVTGEESRVTSEGEKPSASTDSQVQTPTSDGSKIEKQHSFIKLIKNTGNAVNSFFSKMASVTKRAFQPEVANQQKDSIINPDFNIVMKRFSENETIVFVAGDMTQIERDYRGQTIFINNEEFKLGADNKANAENLRTKLNEILDNLPENTRPAGDKEKLIEAILYSGTQTTLNEVSNTIFSPKNGTPYGTKESNITNFIINEQDVKIVFSNNVDVHKIASPKKEFSLSYDVTVDLKEKEGLDYNQPIQGQKISLHTENVKQLS